MRIVFELVKLCELFHTRTKPLPKSNVQCAQWQKREKKKTFNKSKNTNERMQSSNHDCLTLLATRCHKLQTDRIALLRMNERKKCVCDGPTTTLCYIKWNANPNPINHCHFQTIKLNEIDYNSNTQLSIINSSRFVRLYSTFQFHITENRSQVNDKYSSVASFIH